MYVQIIGSELFKVLKEKNGGSLSSLISEKIRVVGGDISVENLGVKDPGLLEEMFSEVEVVVNFAATTNFDERYIYINKHHSIIICSYI